MVLKEVCMTKLSRKDRYQNLRTSLDEQPSGNSARKQTTAPTNSQPAARTLPASEQPASKPVRRAAPDAKAESRPAKDYSKMRAGSSPVIEDLLGEVTQYNLSNGDLVSPDPQMQILHDLSESGANRSKRTRHLVEMEKNETAGGTTRNLYSSDLSALASEDAAFQKAAPAIQDLMLEQMKSEDSGVLDDLDLGIFEPEPSASASRKKSAAPDTSETESRKPKKKKKSLFSRRTEEPEPYAEEDELEEEMTIYPDESSQDEDLVQEDSDLLEEEVILTASRPSIANFRSNAGNPDLEKEDDVRIYTPSTSRRKSDPVEYDDEDDDGRDEEEELTLSRQELKQLKAKKKAEKKAAKEARKARKAEEDFDDYDDYEEESDTDEHADFDEEDQSVSKGQAIFMIVCVIILVILIVLTIYWMSQLGIFG